MTDEPRSIITRIRDWLATSWQLASAAPSEAAGILCVGLVLGFLAGRVLG